MIEALQFGFMQRALLAGVLVSIACGIIGTYVVINRIVFISGGIAHAAYGGIGLSYYLKQNPVLGAIVFLAYGVAYQTGALPDTAPREHGIITTIAFMTGAICAVLAGYQQFSPGHSRARSGAFARASATC